MNEFLLPVGVLSVLFIGLAAMLIVAERVLINYGICAIDINEGEEDIEVEGGDTLLSVLYDHEIYIPSACGGKGTCGECKVTVDSGGGPVLPTETPLLTRRERRSGVRLGCQVKVREDMEVRMPEEYLHVEEFASTVDEVEMLTEDIRFIRMMLDEPEEINFRPGQYVQVQAPSSEGPVYRAYSISNADYEKDRVELIVKLIPGGIGSTYLHNVEPGDPVTFIGPFGDFYLDESPDTELVCVGGGCGMAPIRCIVHSVLKRQPERKVWMFFGARSLADTFYMKQWEELEEEYPNFNAIVALSDPDPDDNWEGETGFIHLSVDKYLDENTSRQAFLCGPPPMIEATTEVLQEKGLRPDQWYYDEFN